MSIKRGVLSDREIEELYAHGQGMMAFARRVEKAVLEHIDRATTLVYCEEVWTKKRNGGQS